MKGLERLVNSDINRTLGNHMVEVNEVEEIRKFKYHYNTVCVVYDSEKTFYLDDCGWGGHSSTTKTLNNYRQYFEGLGYTQI